MLGEDLPENRPGGYGTQFHIREITHARNASDLRKLPLAFIDHKTKIHPEIRWREKFDTRVLLIDNPEKSSGDFLSLLMAMPNLEIIAINCGNDNGTLKPGALSEDLFKALAIYIFDVDASVNLSQFSAASNSRQTMLLTTLFKFRKMEHFRESAPAAMRHLGFIELETEFNRLASQNRANSINETQVLRGTAVKTIPLDQGRVVSGTTPHEPASTKTTAATMNAMKMMRLPPPITINEYLPAWIIDELETFHTLNISSGKIPK
jgi:hypothetical protein